MGGSTRLDDDKVGQEYIIGYGGSVVLVVLVFFFWFGFVFGFKRQGFEPMLLIIQTSFVESLVESGHVDKGNVTCGRSNKKETRTVEIGL